MGVPGFFSWLLRKYKNNSIISSKLNASTKVNILYLDANCLIHPQCFKVLDLYPDWKESDVLEEKMMTRVINYIDYLLKIINPTDELYIAVDGVAPMAKMNQQRKRRYRSSDDKELRDNIKKKHNKNICNSWSNTVITPGTPFMELLNKKLIKYMKSKKNIKVTYSSYHTPGEGEHKILQDIKSRKQELKNKTCVIYGLDADLIFLAMASNQDNLYLLREEQHFGIKKSEDLPFKESKKIIPADILNTVDEEFNYVSINDMKLCINEQIVKLVDNYCDKHKTRRRTSTVVNQDDFIKDFIFVCYLLGNDFLPHLPSVSIKTGGLDFLLTCYVEIYVNLNNKKLLQNNNQINYSFLSQIFTKMAKCEDYYFRVHLPNYQEKRNSRECHQSDKCDIELWELDNMRSSFLQEYDPIKLGEGHSSLWKFRYYEHYFGVNEHQDYIVSNMIEQYLRGVVWVTKYYFESCPSWEWQYTYTHAPFVSDISKYLNSNKQDINNTTFDKSQPLKPFTQLLSVLPPSCKHLLPKSYQFLVTSDTSNILDLYPTDISLDMLNKDMHYECVPLIPCVTISRVKSSIKGLDLDKEETMRNSFLDNYSN